MKKFRKVLILLMVLVVTFFPYLNVVAVTLEGNVSGTSLPSGGSNSNGPSNPAYNCVYILGLAEKYGVYGLRITFYLENGTQTGKTVDVWRWDSKASKDKGKIGTKVSETDANGFSKWKFDKKTRAINSMTKIDYLRIKDGTLKNVSFQVMQSEYVYYHDDIAPTYTTAVTKVTDPLNYLDASDRAALKEYFTTPEVMERYVKLAGANVDVGEGSYSVLLEPMLSLSRMDCPKAKSDYTGRYSATELGLLWEKGLAYTIDNNTLRKMIFTGLFLEKEATLAGYKFELDSKFNVNNKKNGVKKEHITGKYGYGMSIVTGSEVCKENCTSGKKYKVVYHTIDLNNPFLSSNGNTRKISNESNWCKEPSSTSNTCKTTYSINKNIYSQSPILTVTLTPSSISKIRESNKTIDYSKITNTTCKKFWNKFKTESIFSPSTNFCK